MVSEALASVDALATQSIAPVELNGAVSEATTEVSGAAAGVLVQQEVPTDQVNSAADIRTDLAPVRVRRPRQRANMSASQLAEVRRKDRERKAASRSQMTGQQRRVEQGHNSAARALQRLQLSEGERQTIQDRNTVARASQREDMSQEERQIIQERDTTARAVARSQMTGEEFLLQREAQRFRNRSRKYKKGYGSHEDFNPSVIRGKGTLGRRHYFSRFGNNRAGDERQCVHCKAWKFPGETDKCCCRKGKVQLPPRQEAPEKLRRLFEKPDFMKTIRAYNNVFAFTSMGASRSKPLQVDGSVTRGGVYNFRVMGAVCHRMGSLLPPPGANPKFAQIYINDPDSAARVESRIRMTDGLNPEFVSDIDVTMEEHNPYAQQFLHAREILIEWSKSALEEARVERERRREEEGKQEEDMHEPLIDPEVDCALRLHVDRGSNPGTHNTPNASEVAAISIDANASEPRDLVLYTRRGGFNRIYETDPSYDPLQYPLLHPHGEKGWTHKISYGGDENNDDNGEEDEGSRRDERRQQDRDMEEELDGWGYVVRFEDGAEERRKTTMSLREFVAYLLYDRTGSHSLLLLGCRLTQQYCVAQWAKVEQERLRYIEKNQLEFRLESIEGLTDAYRNESTEAQRNADLHDLAHNGTNSTSALPRQNESGNAGDIEASNVGRRLILPPSFTGGPRYMYQRFQDAMAISRELGAPNLSITMTCNPNWLEIKENLQSGQTASDRPDIVARMFMQKLKGMCKDPDEGVLGIQTARIHVVEY